MSMGSRCCTLLTQQDETIDKNGRIVDEITVSMVVEKIGCTQYDIQEE